MKKGWIVLIVVAVVVIALGGWVVSSYNGMVGARESVDAQLADIDAQLTRRADLIPNLVATVEGFNIQEQAIIDSITAARAGMTSGTAQERLDASDRLTGALNIMVESYPDIKSNETFTQLMDELAGTENRISVARQDYNDEVRQYNTRVRSFPANIFAGLFGFEAATPFEAPEGADQAPVVDFGP